MSKPIKTLFLTCLILIICIGLSAASAADTNNNDMNCLSAANSTMDIAQSNPDSMAASSDNHVLDNEALNSTTNNANISYTYSC